ncbi:MAG: glycosyltransferase family 4 protein [Parcubacteria group bacterium]|nr:glycosyltransferase family 4 protein [Parcubacteria group bacterium]
MNNTRKKILYVITKSNFGGAQRYVYNLATSLPKDQFDAAVLLGGDGTLNEKLLSVGIRTIALPYFKRDIHIWNDIKVFFALISIFKKERPDIIHLNSSKAGILGSIAGRVARVPRIIFTSHGWAFNEQRPWWQKYFFLVIHFKTILFSHVTITVSHKTKSQIDWIRFIKNKIVIIHNGIKNEALKIKDDARLFFAQHNNILKQKKEALWIGTIAELHPTKDLLYAIEAIKEVAVQFPDIAYVIAGEGEEREKIEKMIQQYNLHNNVFLLGFVPDIAHYLRVFDIFLVSSISEALSYAVLEAGNARLPVVATKVGGIPEIIEHEKSGLLVAPKNKKEIERAIITLIKNRELRIKLGENLYQVVKKKFNFENMLQKTIDIYFG